MDSPYQGQHFSGEWTGRMLKPGTVFPYQLLLPRGYEKQKLAVLFQLDGLNPGEARAAETLMAGGGMPLTAIVGVAAGTLPATLPGGEARFMRPEEYDQIGSEYADFLIGELLPGLEAQYGFATEESADRHMISGGSSGGCCAFNAAWFRNDYFHRAFLSSPSFLWMRGMEDLVPLVRKTQTRPLRLYVTVATDEPYDYFGGCYDAGYEIKRALEYAGYNFGFEYFEGEGHCARRTDEEFCLRMLTYLWQDWQKPVEARPGCQRLQTITREPWEEAAAMPCPIAARTGLGVYQAEGGEVRLNGKTVAKGFSVVTAVALSSDLWRLYVADRDSRYLYAFSVDGEGELIQRYKLAPLHLPHDPHRLGATALCVDRFDRVFAATELGVQAVRSSGIVDVILPLPGDLPVDQVAFGGENGEYLYAASGDRVFRRKVSRPGRGENDGAQAPKTVEYYDK